MQNSLERKGKKKKKTRDFFCTKMPLGSTGHEFQPEPSVGVCAWKIIDSTLRGPSNKCKILSK